jgi:general secretion pathway protein E
MDQIDIPELEIDAEVAEDAPDLDDPADLAQRFGFEFLPVLPQVNPPKTLLHGEFSKLLGSWAKQELVVPLHMEENTLLVATRDPRNTVALDVVRYCYGVPIRVVVAPTVEIHRAINGVRTSLMSDRENSLESDEKGRVKEISDSLKIDVTDAEDEDAPIIRYVNTLIFRAAQQRASDIHIEPFENMLKVRFRVDGVLHDVDQEDSFFQAAILSRIKVMANLNIAEKRLPQDGRIGLRIAGQDVDIRVSTVPTRYGERVVMRLLDKSKIMLDLATIGLDRRIENELRKLIVKSYGILLVTGPTGSGKTTTLYACLTQINSADKNILTIEDPVEYEVAGVGQMQVNPKIDFTFANGLRSILRQDPDVIMVGEIRDLETVEIAIQASLTGHLVFSTLHTNDAAGAITRLLDMGVEPFLISSSLIAVMAQRLVRTLCVHCKQPTTLNELQAHELGLSWSAELANKTVYKTSENGCLHCQNTGYLGRTGIHELLLIDDALRVKIMERCDASQIRAAARGFKSLRIDGGQKVLDGATSLEEVLRVTQEDSIE